MNGRTFVLVPHATGAAVNHVFPQAVDMGNEYDWDAPDSLRHLPPFAPADVPPNLSAFHLDPETKVTDILSQTLTPAPGLLVSNRLRDEVDHFAIQEHAWYEAPVVHHGRRLRYNWLHFTASLESKIDFTRSTFVVRHETKREKSRTFASEAEFLQECRELVDSGTGKVRVQSVTFLPGVALLDLFVLRLTGLTYYLSHQLVNRLREAEYSGCKILPANASFRSAEWPAS